MQNFNIGLLGHVDSGKTTIAKALSSITSTAAFDKNPQSQERGITLDLGFSSTEIPAPQHIINENPDVERIQLTFVDCPGHASLIRTVIGGAQIVDLMILVVDAQRGIQTQTAECIVIGELLQRKLIVVVNKIDLLSENIEKDLKKLEIKLRKTFAKTVFGANVPIINISARNGANLKGLLNSISDELFIPKRNLNLPLLVYVDHCFSIKGHGTICTGTIVQGKISVGDNIEIPQIKEERKVKSLQVFRRSVDEAVMGDRVGICVTQFNAKLLERGVLTNPGYLKPVFAVCVNLQRIDYYKFTIKHKSKFHITVGHDTVMSSIVLFRAANEQLITDFDIEQEYELVEELESHSSDTTAIFVLIEFERAVIAPPFATLIASKLDMDVHSTCFRLAFCVNIQLSNDSCLYNLMELPKFKIFKQKIKQGKIQRLVKNDEIIVQNLFKKETDPKVFVGKSVELSTGETGIIESKFGKVSKIKVKLKDELKKDTLEKIKSSESNDIQVMMKYKKYIFNKGKGLVQ